jgi:CheY-like chemotaxis protein
MPRRILVVDDDSDTLLVEQLVLNHAGYACDVALGGHEAVSRVGAAEYDLVITDLHMPGMDGFEFIKWLRSSVPHVRIVALSADAFVPAGVEAIQIAKPCEPLALVHAVARVLEGPWPPPTFGVLK